LGGEPPLPGCPGRPRRLTRRRGRLLRLGDEFGKTRACIGAVALLGAETPRTNDEDALAGHASAGEAAQARLHCRSERGGASDVEAQLDRACDLIDILPARPGRLDEDFLDVLFREVESRSDADHGSRPRIAREADGLARLRAN